MVTNCFVSAGDQSSNPSSGGWERASSSYPCKGLSWVTSCGAQSGDRGGGESFVFSGVAFFLWEREAGEERKNKVGPKKVQCVLEHRPSLG